MFKSVHSFFVLRFGSGVFVRDKGMQMHILSVTGDPEPAEHGAQPCVSPAACRACLGHSLASAAASCSSPVCPWPTWRHLL